MKKYNHNKEHYIEAAKNSTSISNMCRYLKIIPAGGNFGTIRRKISEFEIDTSHFVGGYANPHHTYSKNPTSKTAIKAKLIRERGHKCEKCQNTTWLDLPIVLELEHVDGSTFNDEISNLLLLCPNCHAQTSTWRRKKSATVEKAVYYCECGNKKAKTSTRCYKCFHSNRNDMKNFKGGSGEINPKRICICGNKKAPVSIKCQECHLNSNIEKINWPSDEELLALLKIHSRLALGKILGVSDNAIKKRLNRKGLLLK